MNRPADQGSSNHGERFKISSLSNTTPITTFASSLHSHKGSFGVVFIFLFSGLVCIVGIHVFRNTPEGNSVDLLPGVLKEFDSLSRFFTNSNKNETNYDYNSCISRLSLSDALERSKFANKMVIVIPFNWQQKELFDLYLKRFELAFRSALMLKRILVLCFDEDSFHYCCNLGLYCFFDELKDDQSGSFPLKISSSNSEIATPALDWRKLELQLEILKNGYDFVFSELDAFWLKNPLVHLGTNEDMTFACDLWSDDTERIRVSLKFYYAKSNEKTVAFFNHWVEHHYQNNASVTIRDVYMRIRPEVSNYVRNSFGIKVKYVPNLYFGGICLMPDNLFGMFIFQTNCCASIIDKINVANTILNTYDWLETFPEGLGSEIASHGFLFNRLDCSA